MATPQWLQDNPKVLAYVPKDLHNKLCQFKKAHKLKSISEAINLILKSFFELENSLPQSVEVPDSSSQANVLESRIAALEDVVRQLADSVSGIRSDLPTVKQNLLTQGTSKKSDLLLLNSKSLNLHPTTPLAQTAPLVPEQDDPYLAQNEQGVSIIQFAQEEETSEEKISALIPLTNDSNSGDKELARSPDMIQISDISTSSIPIVNPVSITASDLPFISQNPLPKEHFEKNSSLFTSSKSLKLRDTNSSSSQFNPLQQDHKGMSSPHEEREEALIASVNTNKKSSRDEISELVYFKGTLGLLDRNLTESSDSIHLLAKSIFSNPSCIRFSVLKKSRLTRMIKPYEDIELEDLEYHLKWLKKNRKTPYYLIRDKLNQQLTDTKNPLNLDRHGREIIIQGARDLAVLVKQLRIKDDVLQVYIIPLSMLARILIEAGFSVTSSNLLKVRQYVEKIYPEAVKSIYVSLLKQVQCYPKRYY